MFPLSCQGQKETGMDLAKLHEALKDIEAQHHRLQDAAASVRRAIALLSGASVDGHALRTHPQVISADGERTFIDDAVAVLAVTGHEMHVKQICEEIAKSRGSAVRRESVESSIVRHITKAKQPKLARFGPSTYGLPKWKAQPALLNVDMAEAS
jgi:hypothetical protein